MEIYAMHYNALNTGKRIQKLRKDKGLTQEQLAERLNLSTVHMAKIETGQRSCSLDVLTEFAMFFNASLECLPSMTLWLRWLRTVR